MTDPSPGPSPLVSTSTWEKLNTRIPILTSLVQFLLVTLLGSFAKCSFDDYTQKMERIKRVDELSLVLSTQDSEQAITRQNLSLVTLERMLSTPKPGLGHWFSSDDERLADDALLFDIAEEVYRSRLITKVGSDKALFLGRLNLAARIMHRHDSARGRAFLRSVTEASKPKTVSTPDASQVVVQPSSSITIAPENLALAQVATGNNKASAESKYTCYIQFRVLPRSSIENLRSKFPADSWIVPEAERKSGNYDCTVRYFFREDSLKAEKARQITQDYLKTLPNPPTIQLLSLVKKKFAGVRPGQLEVWIAPLEVRTAPTGD